MDKNEKIKYFIYCYENNSLQNIEDFIYLSRDDAKRILEVLSKDKDKIQIINEIILKTGKILPLFSIYFNQYYLYNGNISYQNCINIYQRNLNNSNILYNLLYLYGDIYFKQKEYLYEFSKNKYILLQLTFKQLKQFYLIVFKIYKKLTITQKSTNIILEILIDLYKVYLQITFKQKKFFINIITRIFILEINNYIENTFLIGFIQEKRFINILDLLISNWDLLQNKYKNFLKKKSFEWISFLKEKNNKYLQYANTYLNTINKL